MRPSHAENIIEPRKNKYESTTLVVSGDLAKERGVHILTLRTLPKREVAYVPNCLALQHVVLLLRRAPSRAKAFTSGPEHSPDSAGERRAGGYARPPLWLSKSTGLSVGGVTVKHV